MKKIMIYLCLLGSFMVGCSKSTTNNMQIKHDASPIVSQESETLSRTSDSEDGKLVLIKPELAARVIPIDWKESLASKDSKYGVGEMKTHDGIWLCLVHFSDDLKNSNTEKCVQVTDIKASNSNSETVVVN